MNRTPSGARGRPNIVFIFADEWRAQAAGYAGDPNAHTPHLDAFAARCINFPNAVSGCPVCCPYRASLMTGQYPLTHGVFINDVELDPGCESIARAFKAGGYRTAYIGKWHLYGSPDGAFGRRAQRVPRDYQMGFDDWKGFECSHDYNHSHYYWNDEPTRHTWAGYDAFAQSREAARYIRDHADADPPFLLMLSWGPPHSPLDSAPDQYRAMYSDRPLTLRPNVPPGLEADARAHLAGYYAHIAALDDCLPIVLDAVDQAGIADNTIIVFTSDHGEMAKSQGLNTKLFPFAESVDVPFLLYDPRQGAAKAREITVPIDSPDIMPTLLGLAGLDIPDAVEGRDWSPIVRGERRPSGEEAAFLIMAAEFTEIRFNGMRAYRGLRTDRYTYVRDLDGPWLLFDNRADPFQMTNLIGRHEHAALQHMMEDRLQARLTELSDEFLPGQVYLERANLSHYREVTLPLKRRWVDPWSAPRR